MEATSRFVALSNSVADFCGVCLCSKSKTTIFEHCFFTLRSPHYCGAEMGDLRRRGPLRYAETQRCSKHHILGAGWPRPWFKEVLMKEETLWSIVGSAAAVGASVMSRKAAKRAYQKVSDKEPPENPDRDDVEWREAILWGAATGVMVGVARVVGRSAGRKALDKTRKGGRSTRLLPGKR
ncbi:MAG: hypothetical protein CME78_06825 [Halomonas sp.]|nr:hypothetical protein [Halomonas sp.]